MLWYSCVGHRGKNQQGKGGGCSSLGQVVPNDFGVFARYHTSTGVFNPKLVRKCVSSWLAWILVTLGRRAAGELNSASAPRAPFPRKHENTKKHSSGGLYTQKNTPFGPILQLDIYIYVRGNQGGRGPTRSYPEDTRIILHPSLFSRREDTKAPDPQS